MAEADDGVEAEGKGGKGGEEKAEGSEGEAGGRDIVTIQKEAEEYAAEDAEEPKAGAEIGRGDVIEAKEEDDRGGDAAVPYQFEEGPRGAADQAWSGRAQKTGDERAGEAEDHEAGVGFEGIEGDEIVIVGWPKKDADDGGAKAEWEEESEWLVAPLLKQGLEVIGQVWGMVAGKRRFGCAFIGKREA